MPLVGVVIGSKTDEPLIQPTLDILNELGISYQLSVISAHRTPEKTQEYGKTAQKRGLEVIIAAAGSAAALPGVLASWTVLPVIGIPLPTSELKGIDALYSIVQMPGGVPVACMAVGAAGAKNAALLAARILGLKHEEIQRAVEQHRQKLAGA